MLSPGLRSLAHPEEITDTSQSNITTKSGVDENALIHLNTTTLLVAVVPAGSVTLEN